MSDTVQKIKDRLGIEEVVGTYIKLEKAGKNLKACCPFHNEKTPSFVVSPDRGTFYCFGCGKKGDVFTFVQEFESLDFMGALTLLADRAGVPIESSSTENTSRKKEALSVLKAAATFYGRQLQKNTEAQAYLTKRGITPEIIERWNIGFAPHSWDSVRKELSAQGVSDSMLEHVGLIKRGDSGEYYDRFRDRIMFPICDHVGNVVGFTGRILHPDEKQAKYVNSPETEYFNKSRILYGYHLAKTMIRKHNFSILVEGQVDVIMAHHMGYVNTVGTSGTALSDEQLTLLSRISSRLVLALDADGAGFKASERAWQMALQKGMDVKIARLPPGKDPADIALENPDVWKQAIRESKHIIEFLAEQINQQHLPRRDVARSIHEHIVPYIARIESSIEQAHFVERIASLFSISKDALWLDVQNYSTGKPSDASVSAMVGGADEKQQEQDQQSVEQQVLGIIAWQESLTDPCIDISLVRNTFTDLLGIEAVELLQRSIDMEPLLFATEATYADEKILKQSLDELLTRLERSVLMKRRAECKQKLTHAEAHNDTELQDTLLTELHMLAQRIEQL